MPAIPLMLRERLSGCPSDEDDAGAESAVEAPRGTRADASASPDGCAAAVRGAAEAEAPTTPPASTCALSCCCRSVNALSSSSSLAAIRSSTSARSCS